MTEFRISDFGFRIFHTAHRRVNPKCSQTGKTVDRERGILTRISCESAERLERKSEIRNPKSEMCFGRNR